MATPGKTIEVEQFVSLLVTQLAKRFDRHANLYLGQITDISVHDWRLLVHVYNFRKQKLPDVAKVMNLKPEQAAALARSLSEKHFVQLIDGPDGTVLEPTSVGKGVYETILPYMQQRQELLLEGLSEPEQVQMRTLLAKMSRHMDGLLGELGSPG